MSEKKKEFFPRNLFSSNLLNYSKKKIIEDKVILKKMNKKTKKEILNAIEKNDIEKIKEFKSQGIKLDIKDENGFTPLIISVIKENYEMTLFFLNEYYTDVNAQNNFGDTALHHAHFPGYETLEILLGKGADVNIRNNNNKTPIMESFEYGIDKEGKITEEKYIPMINLLLEKLIYSKNDEKLHHAIELFNVISSKPHEITGKIIETIKRIAEQKTHINKKDNEGNTPLILLAQSRLPLYPKIDLIKILIENGARVSLKNNEGKDAINYTDVNSGEVKTLLETIKWLEDKKIIKN